MARRLKLMGVIGLGETVPGLVPGHVWDDGRVRRLHLHGYQLEALAEIRQKGCVKCGQVAPLRYDGGRELHCAGPFGGCGWTGYLVSAVGHPLRVRVAGP